MRGLLTFIIAIGLAACSTPETLERNDVAGNGDTGGTSATGDTTTSSDVVEPDDTDGVGTTGDTTTDDTSGGGSTDTGGSTGDTAEDVIEPPQPDVGGPDETAPQVISAFSADGLTVTVRFSEEIDPDSGGVLGSYTIKGSDNSLIAITSVTINGRFAALELGNPGDVNEDLTYTCFVDNSVSDLSGNTLDPTKNKSLIKRTVYLNIVWHQHQPLYYEAARDELSGPWVRKHATKDYFDMAAILKQYPDVHLNINLTSVLLEQLKIYNERLLPFVDKATNTVDEVAFLAKWKGKTDPFIDLLLEDTPTPENATDHQIGLLYDDPWATVSTSDATMVRWPEYVALREKNPKQLTQSDFLHLKILFELAWMDPDFIKGPVTLPTGAVVDLTDLVTQHDNGTFTLAVPASEEMANRLVAENAKIIEAVIPIHQEMFYNYQTKEGQLEITMTPFYHPILPLIYNTDLGKEQMPFDTFPSPAYGFKEDADAQVKKAVASYTEMFGVPPQGVWCGEGSVAEDIIGVLVDSGLRWTATDQQVLSKSQPGGQQHWFAYRVDADKVQGDGGSHDDEMLIVFRDTQMSNDIGFKYQSYWGPDAANEIIGNVLAQAPPFGAKDRVVTLIVDGENAWEEYKNEHDGKGFFHALYGGLSESFKLGEIIPTTMTEYIDGNPKRAIPPHPISSHKELEPLAAGSWIDGTYAIWIGEGEENLAWSMLLKARTDLANSGIARPNPLAPPPADPASKAWLIWAAWEEIYAAEGSDWFWWYGADMTTPANDDTPFDQGFRAHLTGMYQFMNAALAEDGKPTFAIPEFPPIIQAQPQPPSGPFEMGKEPTLDGKLVPNEAEWTDAGGFFFDNDSGAQANQDDDINQIYYGYTADALYIGVAANDDLNAKLGSDYQIAIYASHTKVIDIALGTTVKDPANTTTRAGTELNFSSGGAAREIQIDFKGNTPTVQLSEATGSGSWTSSTHAITLGDLPSKGKLLELAIPWADLNMTSTDPLEIQIVATSAGKDLDLAPTLGPKTVNDDPTNAVFVTFEADVSGDVNVFTNISEPPPNHGGKGIVYISGNHDKLQQWIPNKVAMLDDGVAPDKVKGDSIWTLTVPFPPGTLLRYKYTIGLPKDEGKWFGTEEFPLTERGLDVSKNPTVKKMIVSDKFADRPQPSGTVAKGTKIQELSE